MTKKRRFIKKLNTFLKRCGYVIMDMSFYYFHLFHDVYLLRAPSFYLKYSREEQKKIMDKEIQTLEDLVKDHR